VSAQEELFKLIAHRLEDLAMVFEIGGSGEPETPDDGESKREITVQDLNDCADEGTRAKDACKEAGVSRIETCYAIQKITEGKCLEAKQKKDEK